MTFGKFKALWERRKRTKMIRKQMRMTKKCSRELNNLLRLIGIDYSTLELCPIPLKVEKEIRSKEGRRK